MRQPLALTVFAAAAALSLSACGNSGGNSAASAPSTVQTSTSPSTSSSSSVATQTVTQTPPQTVTKTVAPAPTVTQTRVVQGGAAGAAGSAANPSGCSYQGVSIVLDHMSCAFAQNVIAAYQSGSNTAYSPAMGRNYTFSCEPGMVLHCAGDGTSTGIKNGSLLW